MSLPASSRGLHAGAGELEAEVRKGGSRPDKRGSEAVRRVLEGSTTPGRRRSYKVPSCQHPPACFSGSAPNFTNLTARASVICAATLLESGHREETCLSLGVFVRFCVCFRPSKSHDC